MGGAHQEEVGELDSGRKMGVFSDGSWSGYLTRSGTRGFCVSCVVFHSALSI